MEKRTGKYIINTKEIKFSFSGTCNILLRPRQTQAGMHRKKNN